MAISVEFLDKMSKQWRLWNSLSMGIDVSGNAAVNAATVSICVNEKHPLLLLANALPWTTLMAMVVPDLQRTTAKGFWWMGRKILVRVHLAAYILQKLYNLTDRQTEYGLKDNAAYQLFSGRGIVPGWHPPDHTKVEEFRNRLSPETQRLLANETAKIAVSLGFACPTECDFDSTIQEANCAYPSDASLMTKLAGIGLKVMDYLKKKKPGLLPEGFHLDVKAVKAKAREYFFMQKNTAIEQRRRVFKDLHRLVKKQMRPIVEACSKLKFRQIKCFPWNIRKAVDQINALAWRYLLDVGHFTRKHSIKVGKILSFHARAVACIKKGKVGKDKEFGRVFQLGRIKGNFLFVLGSTTLRMNDKDSFVPLLVEHSTIFGEGNLHSIAADKGYWSARNHREISRYGVKENGLQRPGNVKKSASAFAKESQEKLKRRRAGIEPLIGRTKHGGQLGRSKMKSDAATLAAGYSSILGFNLRQISNRQRQSAG